MSDCDGLFALFGICFCCCCFEAIQNDNHWCFLNCCGKKHRVRGQSGGCCSCKRAMTDDDFERTVEEIYGEGTLKPDEEGSGNPDRSTHILELQAIRSRPEPGTVDKQPPPRRSMEAPGGRRSRSRSPGPGRVSGPLPKPGGVEDEDDRERVILEARKEAKSRTLEWIAQHGSNLDVSVGSQSRAHRPHRSEPNALARPDQGGSGRQPSGAHHPRGASEEYARMDHRDRDHEGRAPEPVETSRPRMDIPSSLLPRTQAVAPTQLPFDLGAGQGRAVLVQGAVSSSSPERVQASSGDDHESNTR
ncbi:hypothetical protein C8Q74DRAFT_954629 [Fomes fomentarius]|nr:hypothetical protein C8Q74DRAFT_954629 [Fomes fomentarius]